MSSYFKPYKYLDSAFLVSIVTAATIEVCTSLLTVSMHPSRVLTVPDVAMNGHLLS